MQNIISNNMRNGQLNFIFSVCSRISFGLFCLMYAKYYKESTSHIGPPRLFLDDGFLAR